MIFRARRTSTPGQVPSFGGHDCGVTVNLADSRAWVLVSGHYVEIATVDPDDQEAMVRQLGEGVDISPPPRAQPDRKPGVFQRLFGG